MAVAFVAAADFVSSSAATTATVNVPTGTLDGHVMVLVVNTGGTSITTPAGWTLRLGPTTVPSVGGRVAVFTRTASSEPGSYTVTTGNGEHALCIATYSGVQEVLDGTAAVQTLSVASSVATPTLTTAVNGSLVIRGVATNGASGAVRTWSWAASTKREDNGTAGPSGVSVTVADAVKTTAGSAGTETATASSTVSGVSFTLALQALNFVSNTRTLKWDIQNQVAQTRTLKWDIANQVSATRTLKWDIAAFVAAQRVLKWDILNQVSATRKLVWGIQAQVSGQRIIVYDIAALVAGQRKLVWGIQNQVAGQRQLVWGILNNVSGQRQLVWGIQGQVSAQRVLVWDIQTATLVSGTRTLIWDLAAFVSGSRTLRWDIAALVAHQKTLVWGIEGFVSGQRVLVWDMAANVSGQRKLVWNMSAFVNNGRTLIWDIGDPPPGGNLSLHRIGPIVGPFQNLQHSGSG